MQAITAASGAEAFVHFKTLYVRYVLIYRKLCAAAEGVVHVQKRADIAAITEAVAARLVQLRHVLVKWHPLNPELAKGALKAQPFPWEYIAFDDDTLALKLQPEDLEVSPADVLLQVQSAALTSRNALLRDAFQRAHGLGDTPTMAVRRRGSLVSAPSCNMSFSDAVVQLSQSDAATRIQKIERGRQAREKVRVSGVTNVAKQRQQAGVEDIAARAIQKLVRGSMARRSVRRARNAELVFLGMRPALQHTSLGPDSIAKARAGQLNARALQRRRNEAAYVAALPDLEQRVLHEEGPTMRDHMAAHRTVWIASRVAAARAQPADGVTAPQPLPSDLEQFYDSLKGSSYGGEDCPAGADAAKAPAAPAGGKTGATKPAAAAAATAPPAGAKKQAAASANTVSDAASSSASGGTPPPLAGPSEWTLRLASMLREFRIKWVGRNDRDNVKQTFDEALARAVVRPAVEERVRKEADAAAVGMLANIRFLSGQTSTGGGAGPSSKTGAAAAKGKGKGDAAAAGKSGGGGKGKGGGADGKSASKPLPGAKLCAGMEPQAMLNTLVELRLVSLPSARSTFGSFVGGMNLLASRYSASDTPAQRHPIAGYWVPQDPSMAQIRDALVQYAVLPLQSLRLRCDVAAYCAQHALSGGHAPRSILLYGASGTGKSHLVSAVAHASGAAVIDCSPSALDKALQQQQQQQTGGEASQQQSGAAPSPLQVLHMAFEVAKSGLLGPCVIHIDGAERCVTGAGKAASKASATGNASPSSSVGAAEMALKLRKDLPAYFASLTEQHAVVLIGCSSEPWVADPKATLALFDKVLYVPLPDYTTRLRVWRAEIGATLYDR